MVAGPEGARRAWAFYSPAHWEFAVALQFAVAYVSAPQPVQGEHCLLPPLAHGTASNSVEVQLRQSEQENVRREVYDCASNGQVRFSTSHNLLCPGCQSSGAPLRRACNCRDWTLPVHSMSLVTVQAPVWYFPLGQAGLHAVVGR